MYIKRLNDQAIIPTKSIGNAGFDLAIQMPEPYILMANEAKTFGTGLAIWLDNPRLAGLGLPRSKLGSKLGIVLGNLVGVLDSTYQGELMISVWNRSDQPFLLEDNMLVAQLVIVEVSELTGFKVVDDFDQVTDRGAQGINCEDLRVK